MFVSRGPHTGPFVWSVFMARNLTKGSIVGQLLALSAPLLLGSILQQLYNAADTIIVERYAGETAFAAVGVAGTVMNLFIFLVSGGCTGVSIVMASLFGAEDRDALRRESFMAAAFGMGFAVLLSVASILLIRPVLRLISTPDLLMPYAKTYLVIVFAGIPATFLYNLCAASLRAIGNTARATLFLIVAVVLNVLLDLLFIGALKMGVAGAALATVLSQLASALLCLVYIIKKQAFLMFRKQDMRIDRALLGRTARFAAVSALNQSSLYIGKLLVQGAVNSVSLDAISGFTAGSRIEALTNAFGVCGGEALSVFVAQNLGARQGDRARKGFGRGMLLLMATGVVLSLVMFIPARPLVRLFISSDTAGAVAEGVAYVRDVSIFYVICFADCALLGWNRGSGELDIFMIGTIGQVVLRVSFSWILAPKLGLAGVAFATGIGWICLVIFKTIMYFVRKKTEDF